MQLDWLGAFGGVLKEEHLYGWYFYFHGVHFFMAK